MASPVGRAACGRAGQRQSIACHPHGPLLRVSCLRHAATELVQPRLTYRYIPLHTVTYRYIPLHAISCRSMPFHTVIDGARAAAAVRTGDAAAAAVRASLRQAEGEREAAGREAAREGREAARGGRRRGEGGGGEGGDARWGGRRERCRGVMTAGNTQTTGTTQREETMDDDGS